MMILIDPNTGLATLPSDNLRWVIEPWNGYPSSNILKLQKLYKIEKRVEIPITLSFWDKVCGKSDVKYELQNHDKWVTVYFRPFKEGTPSCKGPNYDSLTLWSRDISRRADLLITKELVQEFSLEIMGKYVLDIEAEQARIARIVRNESFRGEYPPKNLTAVVEGGSL